MEIVGTNKKMTKKIYAALSIYKTDGILKQTSSNERYVHTEIVAIIYFERQGHL